VGWIETCVIDFPLHLSGPDVDAIRMRIAPGNRTIPGNESVRPAETMSTLMWRPRGAEQAAVGRSSALDGSRVGAVVLAGSHAWRRSSIEALLPRPLLPVADTPLIAHPLRWLTAGGAPQATICTNGLTSLIQGRLETVEGLPALAYREDEAPRGPAGCAADALAGSDAERLLLVESSTIPSLDPARLLHEHRASNAAVTVVVQPRDRSAIDGSIPMIPAGIYVFERHALAEVPSSGYQDIKEMLLQRLHRAGHFIRIHEADGWCHQVVDARTYLNVNQVAIRTLCADRVPATAISAPLVSAWSAPELVVHHTSRIDAGAVVVGPVLAGAGCHVMAGATIIGPASIGARTVVRPGAVLSRSVVWDRCTIGEHALVDQSVVVHDVQLREGSRLVEAIGTPRSAAFAPLPGSGGSHSNQHSIPER
jgi:NDP-sugar pyrophosphorylase family protein